MAVAKANLELIRYCHRTASDRCNPDFYTSMKQRRTNSNNDFLLSEIQNFWDAEAYIAYLIGKIGLVELRVLLCFKNKATQNLLIQTLSTLDHHKALENFRNMTKESLLDQKRLNTIVEFLHEQQKPKANQRGAN